MKKIELKIGEYFQQGNTSCLAAVALIALNYRDTKKWKLDENNERVILENIRFTEEDNFGCYTKLIDFLSKQKYNITFFLGSLPKEEHSNDKNLYDIWMNHYKKIEKFPSVSISNPRKEQWIKTIDDTLFKEKVPIIFYSNARWHNLIIYGKINENNYLIFDPFKGRKIYDSKTLKKALYTPWGINAMYIKN